MSPIKKPAAKIPDSFQAMSGLFAGMPDQRTDEQVLEDFVLRNPELTELEALLDRFNIFEAMRAERTESRHSDFLAFLLDPGEAHGLGDSVIKMVLQAALKAKGDYPTGVTPIDLDSWNLTSAVVSREESNIDVLIRFEAKERKFVIIIENKIDSIEHDNQLARYYSQIAAQNPEAKVIALYLTPEGDLPSDERYLPLDYGLVANHLSRLLEQRKDGLGAAVKLSLEHYVDMLRRHIVSESEVARLAKIICTKHRRAIDILFEHRPDTRMQIVEQLGTLIKGTPGLTLTRASKSHLSFTFEKLSVIPRMQDGDANYFIGDRRCLLYAEFKLTEEAVDLGLVVGPGPKEYRRKILEKARQSPALFNRARASLREKWNTILSRKVLTKKDFVTDGPVSVPIRVNSWWSDFQGQTLPAIVNALEDLSLG